MGNVLKIHDGRINADNYLFEIISVPLKWDELNN